MKSKFQFTALLLSLSAMSVLAVAVAAIVTHYPGVIGLGFKLGPNSGQIIIDGRSNTLPAIHPAD